MGLTSWSGRRIALLWLGCLALLGTEWLLLQRQTHLRQRWVAQQTGVQLVGDSIIMPTPRPPTPADDSMLALTFVLLRERAQHGGPSARARPELERLARGPRLPAAVRDSLWGQLQIPPRLSATQQDSMRTFVMGAFGQALGQVEQHWGVLLALGLLQLLVVLGPPVALLVVTVWWVVARRQRPGAVWRPAA